MERTTFMEQANGLAYTRGGVTVLFPYGGLNPKLIFGDSLVTILEPERFGTWNTRKERLAFVRRFRNGGRS